MAAQADPSAKLYYNDYNLEYNGAKAKAAARIVEMIKAYGVRIDGVGLQGHLVVESTPTQSQPVPDLATLEASLRLYTDQGVDVAYTEIDIRMRTPVTQQKLQVQAEQYARVFQSCLNVPRCVGITVWVRTLLFLAVEKPITDFFSRAFLTDTLGSPVLSLARMLACSGMATTTRSLLTRRR